MAALTASAAAIQSASTSTNAPRRRQWISFARHGQAQHNIRAEKLRDEGCAFDVFIQTMKEDDAFDADLTEKGRREARDASSAAQRATLELVVASPLSRAIETATLLYPEHTAVGCNFVALEPLREWSGQLENGRRRDSDAIKAKFPARSRVFLFDGTRRGAHPRPSS